MLAIAGGKGGCGKTTTTLGLAVALDGPVAAADADFDMPNLHSLAGVPRDPPAQRRCHSHPDDAEVTVYPVPTDPNRAEAAGRRVTGHLRRVRADAEGRVLVDCPAGAGPDAVAPLREADGVVLVTPPCAAALRDTVKTGAMADALGTPVLGAVLTRCRVVPPGVESLLGCPVLGRVPPASPPVLDGDDVRRAYRALADEIDRRRAA